MNILQYQLNVKPSCYHFSIHQNCPKSFESIPIHVFKIQKDRQKTRKRKEGTISWKLKSFHPNHSFSVTKYYYYNNTLQPTKTKHVSTSNSTPGGIDFFPRSTKQVTYYEVYFWAVRRAEYIPSKRGFQTVSFAHAEAR